MNTGGLRRKGEERKGRGRGEEGEREREKHSSILAGGLSATDVFM